MNQFCIKKIILCTVNKLDFVKKYFTKFKEMNHDEILIFKQ